MHNELFHIGPFTIYGYGLMIAIGILAAYFLAEYRAKKLGLDADAVFGIVVWTKRGKIKALNYNQTWTGSFIFFVVKAQTNFWIRENEEI